METLSDDEYFADNTSGSELSSDETQVIKKGPPSLNPDCYTEEDRKKLTLAQDLTKNVVVAWREKPVTRGGIPVIRCGVYPGSWCMVDNVTNEGWTFFWPPATTSAAQVKKFIRD